MIVRPRRRAKDPFHHADPSAFNYDLLLEAMALCRREAESFQSACGVRNPAWRETQALIE